MTFDEFLSKWTQKPVDFDGIYPNQCMDLMHQYVYDVLGITDKSVLAAPAAFQVFTNYNSNWDTYFEKIPNTQTGVPEKGDIVFFGQAIGPFGHVCIFTGGDTKKFTSFDANWPEGSLPHIQSHNYTGVLGWLHPKTIVPQMQIDKETFEQLVGKSTEYDKFTAAGYPHIDEVLKALEDKEKTIQGLSSDLKNANDSINTYLDQLQKLNEQERRVDGELIDAQKAKQPLQDTILGVKKELSIEDDSQIIPTIQTIKKSKVKREELPIPFAQRFVYCLNLLFERG